MKHSGNAKHKLAVVAVLLALFAIPFVLQTDSLTMATSKAVLAGGAVVNGAVPEAATTPSTNNASQAAATSGSSFTGVLVR